VPQAANVRFETTDSEHPPAADGPIAVKIFRKDNVALSLAEALAFKLPREIGLQLKGHYLRGEQRIHVISRNCFWTLSEHIDHLGSTGAISIDQQYIEQQKIPASRHTGA
jgi:hypothetical protein